MIILFQNILLLKYFLACNGCFGLFTKINRRSGTSFWCTFFAWFFHITSKAMAYWEKKRGRQKYKNLNISRTKRAFNIKNIFHIFWRAIIWLEIKKWWKIADTSFKRQPRKMVKHTQIIGQQKPTSCLSVFDNFVGLTLKGLIKNVKQTYFAYSRQVFHPITKQAIAMQIN